jgi:hypothetical protein
VGIAIRQKTKVIAATRPRTRAGTLSALSAMLEKNSSSTGPAVILQSRANPARAPSSVHVRPLPITFRRPRFRAAETLSVNWHRRILIVQCTGDRTTVQRGTYLLPCQSIQQAAFVAASVRVASVVWWQRLLQMCRWCFRRRGSHARRRQRRTEPLHNHPLAAAAA